MKHKEFYDLADEMEAACGDWENSEGLSEEAMKKLIAKVEAMDAEEADSKEQTPPVNKRFRLKKRYLVVLAAALALLMGTGVVGDRAWISDSKDMERESEITTKVNNEDKDSILLEEEAIYQEIAEKLGIAAIRLGYLPDGMVLDSYTIVEDSGWAYVNYLYNEKVISVKMAKRSAESSSNIQWDGDAEVIKDITNIHGYEDNIEAYCIDDENQNYTANIKYGNGYYNIYVPLPENEFIEILNYIYFKNL